MAITPVQAGDLIQASTINNLVNSAFCYSLDTGNAANSYKVTYSGASPNFHSPTALIDGQILTFKALHNSTGASNLEVVGAAGASLGSFPIVKPNGAALSLGDIVAGKLVRVIYNSSLGAFQLLSPSAGAASVSSVYRLNTQSVANNTWTLIVFEGVTLDTNAFWSAAAPERLTVPPGLGGFYLATFVANFDANANGARYAELKANGVFLRGITPPTAATTVGVTVTAQLLLSLAPGGYVQGAVYQSSGANLNVFGGGATTISLAYLGS
jgi:hypothetical protein